MDAARRLGARPLLDQAMRTDRAAAECWTALLAGCGGAARRELWAQRARPPVGGGAPPRRERGPQLRRLSEATSTQVGSRWWFAEGAGHRKRVAGAQENLEEGIRGGGGRGLA